MCVKVKATAEKGIVGKRTVKCNLTCEKSHLTFENWDLSIFTNGVGEGG